MQSNRYPFPIPFGWFSVGYPEDFPSGDGRRRSTTSTGTSWRGATRPARCTCRTRSARTSAPTSATAARSRAASSRCPFHGWKFDAEGANTDIPYSDRTNRKAQLRTYPVVERNGFVLAWYHPDDERADVGGRRGARARHRRVHAAPIRTAPRGRRRRAGDGRERRRLRALPLRAQHRDRARDRVVRDRRAPRRVMRSRQKFPTPRGVVDGRIDTAADGPGVGIVRFSGIVDTLLVRRRTPDRRADHRDPLQLLRARPWATRRPTRRVGKAFANEVDKQFAEDTPIWEHKAHLVRPALADTDGPFMKFRKWYAQFYAEPWRATTASCTRRRCGRTRSTTRPARPPPPPGTAT